MCAKIGHKAAQCYHASKSCSGCGRKGHILAACRANARSRQNPAEQRSKAQCWKCGKSGHKQHECKAQRADKRQKAQARPRNEPRAPQRRGSEERKSQDHKPPSVASQQWIKEQDAKLELKTITPEMITTVTEIRRLINIEVDAKVAGKKVAIKIDRLLKAGRKKVTDRFFVRTTGEWKEIERETSGNNDLVARQKALANVLTQDADMARAKANTTVDQLILRMRSKRGASPFTALDLERMTSTLSYALRTAYDRENQQAMEEMGEHGDRAAHQVAAWYTKLITLANEATQAGWNAIEKGEAERVAREQAKAARQEMEIDEAEDAPPQQQRRRTENRWTPARGKSKSAGRAGRN